MNESLQRTTSWLREQISGIPPAVGAVTLLVLVALGLAMATLPRLTARSDDDDGHLFPGHTFSQAELLPMEAAMLAAELKDYSVVQGRIRVRQADRAKYVQAITEGGALPPNLYDPTRQAIKNSHLIEPGSLRDLRFRHASEVQASLAVKAVGGVEDAFVHYDEAERRGLRAERDIRALVGVLTQDGEPLDADLRRTIHDIVLGWKAGLRAENVTVIDLRWRRPYRGDPRDESSTPSPSYLAEKRSIQNDIQRVLRFIPKAQVAVSVQKRISEQTALASQSSSDVPTVAVSVQVPSSYLRSISRERLVSRNPSMTDLENIERETRNKIRAAIAPLLPAPGPNQAQPSISITTFHDVPSEQSPLVAEQPRWWTGQQNVVVIALIAFATTAILFFLNRETNALPKHVQVPLKIVSKQEEVVQPPVDLQTGQRRPRADTSLRDQLQAMVQRDPEKAARTLSEWIDKAG